MESPAEMLAALRPLFERYRVPMVGATKGSLELFTSRATAYGVPEPVAGQLRRFYAMVDGVPCLDSLSIHSCRDLIIFEWWDRRELWLGQRDFYTLRWSSDRNGFCIGEADFVSFSPDHEFQTFDKAVEHLARLYEVPDTRP